MVAAGRKIRLNGNAQLTGEEISVMPFSTPSWVSQELLGLCTVDIVYQSSNPHATLVFTDWDAAGITCNTVTPKVRSALFYSCNCRKEDLW